MAKKRSHRTTDGFLVHSFQSLLGELARRARVTYRVKAGKAGETPNASFQQTPEPTPLQARADELIRAFSAAGN